MYEYTDSVRNPDSVSEQSVFAVAGSQAPLHRGHVQDVPRLSTPIVVLGPLRTRLWAVGFGILAGIGWGVAHATYQPNISADVIGRTPAEVQAKFTSVIYHNLYSGNPARFNNLSNTEWAGLAYAYTRNGGSLATLDAMVAARVPAVYTRYHYVSRNKGTTPFVPPSTGINDTLYDIYLDFRTAPYGAASSSIAMLQTTVYAAVLLRLSYNFGQEIGGGLHWLIVNYDPPLDNAIGADMAWIVSTVTSIGDATTSGIRGFWEWQLNTDFFQVPMIDLGSPYIGMGDWGVMDDVSVQDITGNFCVNPGEC